MAADWLEISSANYDSHCGDDAEPATLVNALDGIDAWVHSDPDSHLHWFMLDLKDIYQVDKIRCRSHSFEFLWADPRAFRLEYSLNKVDWTSVAGTHSFPSDGNWHEIEFVAVPMMYLRVFDILSWDSIIGGNYLYWGNWYGFTTIFDVYGDIVAPPAKGAMQTGKYWGEPI